MVEVMQWLEERAPGFAQLSDGERGAIVEFTFLWSLFESRVLDTAGSAARICTAVNTWREHGGIDAAICNEELAYFRERYFADGEFTYHFEHLHLRNGDREPLVRQVLDGSNGEPGDCLAAVLIIVLRYRNNLFHGIKWQYKLAGQFENFTHANSVLRKVLEQHGRLAEG